MSFVHALDKIDVSKSKLFFSKNVGGIFARVINEKWGMTLRSDLGRYLRVSIFHDRVTKC